MKSLFIYVACLPSAVLCQDPGLPFPNPSISYWQIPPHKDVADHQSQELPATADVVIIGSGLTGASVAWHLLKQGNKTNPLNIAMLEARQACSGATGRNGGHIRPSSYSEYAGAKEVVSQPEAAKITRLRSAHVDALISAANELPEEGRRAAEARTVDSIDGFFDEAQWKEAVKQLDALKQEVPDVGAEWDKFDNAEARKISLLPEVTGILTGTSKMAGAIWPYRFVTYALKDLLDTYPSFSLDTSTPALNISTVSDPSTPFNFQVTTARGSILTRHIVHAANAWIPHLVPGLQGAITGGRLHMSAQLGGSGLPKAGQWPIYTGNVSLPGGRAWSLYRNGLDYIVQMPQNGEYMFGGGIGEDSDSTSTTSNLDDSFPPNHVTASYLNGALSNYFGYDKWGPERTDFPHTADAGVWPGRTKRVWVGIEGSSGDGRPFVGRLPESITTRSSRNGTVGAEWISAAYDGEGMCFAWLCGQALSNMILDHRSVDGANTTANIPEWFPRSFLVTENRTTPSGMADRRRMSPRMANTVKWS